jgi:hypothetical protein
VSMTRVKLGWLSSLGLPVKYTPYLSASALRMNIPSSL